MIADRFMDFLASGYKETPEQPVEQAMAPGQQPGDVLVAEAQRFHPRTGRPIIGPTMSDVTEPAMGLLNMGAATAKGAVQGFAGLPGDIEALGYGVKELLNRGADESMSSAFMRGLQDKTIAPTTEEVKKWLDTNVGTVGDGKNPYETVGEVLAPGGHYKAGKALVKGAASLAPEAGQAIIKSMEKLGTPVQMNIVPPGPSAASAATKAMAPASDIGFYSAVEKAALNVQRNSGSGQSFLNDITKGENVKLDEIKWMGLDDFLKGKKNVTKQEVQDFVQNNRVDVKEVTLGGAEPYDAQRLSQLESEYKALKQHPIDDPSFGENKYDEMIRLMNIRDQSTVSNLYDAAENAMRSAQRAQQQGNKLTAEKYWKENELLNTRAEKLDLQGQGMSNPPKYDKYQLPGGENYREILLTLPNAKPNPLAEIQQKTKRLETMKELQAEFTAIGDTEKANSFAIKANDLEASIKELQNVPPSRQTENYRSSHFDQPNILAHLRVNDRVDADGKKMLLIEEVQSDWHQAGREKGYETPELKSALKEYELLIIRNANGQKLTPDELARVQELRPIVSGKSGGIPDAPFKDTWYQLALKRALRYAADNGYDRVGLTTGKQQAERYDLAKQVDEVIAKRNEDGTFNISATMVDGGGQEKSVGKNIPVDKLQNYVGKDLAKSIQAQEFGTDVYSGDQLKVGGEGMKKYYDDVYPKFLEKYGKKWGASVGETQIKTGRGVPGGEPVRFIDITPEMRKSVQKGQPLAAVSSESTVA
jgi:hypothetical protein